jgi:hypothetical protein
MIPWYIWALGGGLALYALSGGTSDSTDGPPPTPKMLQYIDAVMDGLKPSLNQILSFTISRPELLEFSRIILQKKTEKEFESMITSKEMATTAMETIAMYPDALRHGLAVHYREGNLDSKSQSEIQNDISQTIYVYKILTDATILSLQQMRGTVPEAMGGQRRRARTEAKVAKQQKKTSRREAKGSKWNVREARRSQRAEGSGPADEDEDLNDFLDYEESR